MVAGTANATNVRPGRFSRRPMYAGATSRPTTWIVRVTIQNWEPIVVVAMGKTVIPLYVRACSRVVAAAKAWAMPRTMR